MKKETIDLLEQIGESQKGQERTKENAIKINNMDYWANTIEDAVGFLVVARELYGANVSYDFNGHTLYSEGITLDSAYMEILGQTKKEFDAAVEAERQEFLNPKKTKEEEIDEVIQRGKLVVETGKEDAWESFVKENSDDKLGFSLVKNALEVMEAFEKGKSMEEAHKIFDSEGHSGFSASWTLAKIEGFGDKDNLFLQEYINMEKNGAFYSLGKEEIAKIEETIAQKMKENEIDEEDFIQRGKRVIEPGLEAEWEKFVRDNEGDSGILLVRNALEVMEAFADGKSMKEAHRIFDSEGHSGFSANFTLAKIEHFCDKDNPIIKLYIDRESRGYFYELEKMDRERKAEVVDVESASDEIKAIIQRGYEVIEPGKENAWASFVRKNEEGMGLSLVVNALEVMEAFKEGKSMEEAHKIFDSEGHSGSSASWTLSNIDYFCDKTNPEIQLYVDKESAGAFYQKIELGD